MLTWEHPHCQPFRDLLAHRKIIPYMNTFFGRGWKLDHHPFMITGDMNTKKGKARPQGEGNFHVGGGGTMHGSTARHFNGSQYYTYANGQMRNGMIVAAFQLRAINEGDGGFGLIPGVSRLSIVLLRSPALTQSRCGAACAVRLSGVAVSQGELRHARGNRDVVSCRSDQAHLQCACRSWRCATHALRPPQPFAQNSTAAFSDACHLTNDCVLLAHFTHA
jgi:hypothetical protein